MTKPDVKLRVITVIDPVMCLRCPHAHIADVLFTDGSTRKMFYCSRLDCDNWQCPVDEVEESAEDQNEAA